MYGSIDHFKSLRYKFSTEKSISNQLKYFYERQNSIIDKYITVLDSNDSQSIIDEKIFEIKKRVNYLTTISLLINVCLFFMKIVASILSNSLSVISSVIDSAVDLVSSLILFWTARIIQHRNQYQYPAGRARLEPIAIIILSVIMCSASVQVLSEASKRLLIYIEYLTNSTNEIPEVNMNLKQPFPIVVMCLTIGKKRRKLNLIFEN